MSEAAIESLNKAIKLQPEYMHAHYNLGVALKKLGKYQEAIASYNKAIQTSNPDYADAQYNLGHILTELKRYEVLPL